MGYLQAVGRAFAAMARDAGLVVKFQVGEPWWWIMGDGRICLYDAAAQAAFGAALVSIADVRGVLAEAQKDLLERAGEVLAASTAALTAAVRDEAPGALTHRSEYHPSLHHSLIDISSAVLCLQKNI